jgi:Zn-dependent protease with chaperone function
MFAPLVNDRLLDQIVRHLLLSVSTGVFWFFLVLLFLRVFRVKNPGLRCLLLILPLAKSIMVLISEGPQVQTFKGVLMVNARLPNFRFLDWGPDFLFAEYQPSSKLALIPTAAIIAAALAFFAWRLASLIRFQSLLATAGEVSRADHPQFFSILDRLISQAAVPYPKVIAVRSSRAPFTVGIRRPLIAMSPSLLEQLDPAETEAVLAHEIAHIARKDYLYHWPVLIMRDILFFNPIAPLLYKRISFERERACDDFSSGLTKPLALARSLVKVAEIQRAEPEIAVVRVFAPQGLLLRDGSSLAGRVKPLVEPAAYASPGSVKRLLVALGVGFFLFFEIHLAFALLGRLLVLT